MMSSNRQPIRNSLRRSGFTLAEVVIVVLIMSLAASVTIPRWANAVQSRRVFNAATRIAADLNRAQSAAYHRSASITVTFAVSSSQYTLGSITNMDRKSQTSTTVDLTIDPYLSKLTSVSFGGATSVTYSGFGLPTNGGTIVVSSGGYSKTVTVDANSGKANVQ